MLALAICILASTIISLIFKGFQIFGVRNLPAIVVNYFVCVVCGSLFQGEFPLSTAIFSQDWIWLAFVLGFIFIGGFNLNALSVQRAGIAVTSVVQRISLLISVLFAVFFFHEPMGMTKGLGILMGIAAVFLTVKFESSEGEKKRSNWILPIGVFIVAGLIEVLLTVAQRAYQADGDVTFSVTLFCWAGILGLVWALLKPPADGSPRFTGKDVLGGIALGIPNFFSIHLILVALGQGLDAATVFPVLNVTTIVLSAIAALVFFREQLSPKQWLGVGVATFAILLITGTLG
ncbi:MAG: EamA family transporter [Saprospiraceae bacterium]